MHASGFLSKLPKFSSKKKNMLFSWPKKVDDNYSVKLNALYIFGNIAVLFMNEFLFRFVHYFSVEDFLNI